MAIIAPNIDKISADAFDPRTPAGRRTLRGLLVFAASIVAAGVVIGLVVAVQWAMALQPGGQ
ncbi:hypothetical protein [Leifsonia sp. NPDC058230]|uniref:hypothetical protein n=1 Tax=Leifsonia sp. NPDC058230 TaxID=3346391 RepID=UPI0036DAEDC9